MAVRVAKDKPRCPWPKSTNALYVHYHDTEWGVPEHDDRALFEKLILDGAQAGLSWETILNKRENYRRAYEGFHPEVMARWGAKQVTRLLADPGIVRNRAKVEASITNARAYLDLVEREGAFGKWLWSYVDGAPIQNGFERIGQIKATSDVSDALSKDLKKLGFKFVGSTIVYAYMQAIGMVNDHLVTCFRYDECARLAKRKRKP